jgi:hypothetical protein
MTDEEMAHWEAVKSVFYGLCGYKGMPAWYRCWQVARALYLPPWEIQSEFDLDLSRREWCRKILAALEAEPQAAQHRRDRDEGPESVPLRLLPPPPSRPAGISL